MIKGRFGFYTLRMQVIHYIQLCFLFGIQTRRILGIHCDSDDLIYFAHWFFIHHDFVYLRLRDLMGFRDCQTNVIAHKIAGSL